MQITPSQDIGWNPSPYPCLPALSGRNTQCSEGKAGTLAQGSLVGTVRVLVIVLVIFLPFLAAQLQSTIASALPVQLTIRDMHVTSCKTECFETFPCVMCSHIYPV